MSRDMHAEKNRNMKLGNKSFEILEQFRYLGTTLTNQNSIQEEIKGKFKSGNARFHSVQNILSSSLSSKNVKNQDTQNCDFACFLCGCEAWSILLRVQHRLRVFDNKKMFGPRRDKVTGSGRNYISKS